MYLKNIRMRGINRFSKEIFVDLESLGPGVIAIAGPNGAGKTTILEAWAAAMWLEFPSRPWHLSRQAHGRDAFIEVEFGSLAGLPAVERALIRIDADANPPRQEAFLDIGGTRTSGKIAEYKEAVLENFGTQRLALASTIACQDRLGAFLSLARRERMVLFAEMLDTEGLQRISDIAKEQLVRKRSDVDSIAHGLALAARQSEQLDGLNADKLFAEGKLAEVERGLQTEKAALSELQSEISKLQVKIESDRKHSAGRRSDIAEQLNAARSSLRLTTDAKERLSRDVGIHKRRLNDELERIKDAENELAEIRSTDIPGNEHKITVIIDEIMAINSKVLECESKAEEKRKTLERFRTRNQKIAEMAERAEPLSTIPCASDNEPYASCPMISMAKHGQQELERLGEPVSLTELSEDLSDLKRELETLHSQREHKKEEERLLRSELDLDRMTESHRTEKIRQIQRMRSAETIEQELQRLDHDTTAELDQLDQQSSLQRSRIDKLSAELQELEELVSRSRSLELEDLEVRGSARSAAVELLQRERDDLIKEVARLEAEVAVAKKAAAEVRSITSQLKPLEDEVLDLELLRDAFGRNGIQALEIDAAAPEISDLTTRLLHSCFGDRFDCVFTTQSPTRDGRMKEVFDLVVLDKELGVEGPAAALSGGEKVLVAEAMSLAAAIYSGRHRGRRFGTLFRDETSGALDSQRVELYVPMLRQALELSGTYQMLFISQQPHVIECADRIIWVDDGEVEIK